MLSSDSFSACLDSLQGYSTGEFQATQLIVLAVFHASCILVHFLEIYFEMIVGLIFWHNVEQFL